MNKKLSLIPLVILTTILAIVLSSAYDGYYYPSHSYGSYGSYGYPANSFKETKTFEDQISSTQTIDGITERRDISIKEKITIQSNPNYYGPSSYSSTYYYRPNQYVPAYRYTHPSYSNFRYQRPFNYCDYNYCPINTYTTPYYYQPRFDPSLGHYNWRY